MVTLYIFAGNILSVFVLSCPEMRSNFNQLLIALSVFDLLYLVMSLRLVGLVQDDQAAWSKPPVDIELKLRFSIRSLY